MMFIKLFPKKAADFGPLERVLQSFKLFLDPYVYEKKP